MTTTDQIDSNDEWPDAIGPERKEDSGLRPADGHGINPEEPHHNPEKADLGGGDQPTGGTVGAPVQPVEPRPPNASGLLLFVAAILAFAVLIAVGGVLMFPRANPSTAAEPAPQQQTSPAPVTRELGTVDSTAAGVKGHLTTRWDGKLDYNFLVEPDDPTRQAAFALTVSNPPRPASIRIQINNSNGFVVCFQDVLLRFDPHKAAAISDAPMQRSGGRPLSAKAAEEMKNEQEAGLAQEEATEAEREHGRSIFQLNAGANGKIESISAQGEIPCPQTSYEGMGYWSFLSDLPSPEEQTEWLKQQTSGPSQPDLAPIQQAQAPLVPAQVRQIRGQAPQVSSQARLGAGHKRMSYKSSPQPEAFLMAGDDSIVEYDTTAGSIETRTGKIFSIDKAGTAARVIAGYDLPVRIHYSCDQNAACTLTQGSSMAVHAHLDK